MIATLLSRCAQRFGDRVAVEAASGASALTYRELAQSSRHGAAVLRAVGLATGDRVLLAMDGSPDWIVGFSSIMQAGLVAVPIPAGLAPETARLAAWHVEARACVHDVTNQALGPSLPGVPCVTTAGLLAGGVETRHEPARETARAGTDTAVLVFTSGSTARPRAVELTHENLVANLESLVAVRHGEDDEALLSVLPPAHLFELVAGQLAPLAVGARIVYAGTRLPNRLIESIRERRITRALLVPALVEALCRDVIDGLIEQGEAEPLCRHRSATDLAADLRHSDPRRRESIRQAVRERLGASFHTVAVGGAALDPAWPEVLAAVGIAVDVGYGLTEAGPLVSMGLASEMPAGSVGRPLPGVQVRIDGHGEILVRSAGVMHGYFKDRDASAISLDGGWLRTGDRGRIDDRGFLFVTGRLKDAIVKADGETVYPDEIEPYYASPLFAEHCVVPARGRDGNDVPTLVVVPSRADTTEAEIQRVSAALRRAAPSRCHVGAVVVRSEPLPRSALGKLQRRALAEALK